jgi:hypothetical protein
VLPKKELGASIFLWGEKKAYFYNGKKSILRVNELDLAQMIPILLAACKAS